jgi:hypothetical protein
MFAFWTKSMRIKALEREVVDLWSALGRITAAPAEKLILKPSRKPKPAYVGPRCDHPVKEYGKAERACMVRVKEAGLKCRYHRAGAQLAEVVQSTNGVV